MKKYFSLLLLISPLLQALTYEEEEKIGRKIWENEAGEKKHLLAFWNERDAFPKFGIGHFVWFPQGVGNGYRDQFPIVCDYLLQNGIALPEWLLQALPYGAPWNSREEFLQDTTRRAELCNLLADPTVVSLQTSFMIERLNQQLPHVLSQLEPSKYYKIMHYVQLMQSTLQGSYALIDYLNFRGDGLNPQDFDCDRWGLLRIFLDMPDGLTEENIVRAFIAKAAIVLAYNVDSSAPSYSDTMYLHGWMRRISTYQYFQ